MRIITVVRWLGLLGYSMFVCLFTGVFYFVIPFLGIFAAYSPLPSMIAEWNYGFDFFLIVFIFILSILNAYVIVIAARIAPAGKFLVTVLIVVFQSLSLLIFAATLLADLRLDSTSLHGSMATQYFILISVSLLLTGLLVCWSQYRTKHKQAANLEDITIPDLQRELSTTRIGLIGALLALPGLFVLDLKPGWPLEAVICPSETEARCRSSDTPICMDGGGTTGYFRADDFRISEHGSWPTPLIGTLSYQVCGPGCPFYFSLGNGELRKEVSCQEFVAHLQELNAYCGGCVRQIDGFKG